LYSFGGRWVFSGLTPAEGVCPMPQPALTVLLLLTIALGIIATAALPYIFYRTPQTRFALVGSLLLVFALLTLAPLLFLRPLSAADLAPGEVVTQWTWFYGRDTPQAAALTTARFRKGEAPRVGGRECRQYYGRSTTSTSVGR